MPQDRSEYKEWLNRYGLKLDPLTIHNKDFAVRLRGYDQGEVDDFLDEIIEDYERMVAVIEELEKQMTQTIVPVKEPPREPEAAVFAPPPSTPAAAPAPAPAKERHVTKDELTMIKVRLANLERKVFGSSRSE